MFYGGKECGPNSKTRDMPIQLKGHKIPLIQTHLSWY